MEKESLKFNIILKPEAEGGFTVIVPALPGCVTYGEDLDEAKRMAKDAIKGYIVSLRKHKEAIPRDQENLFASIEVKSSCANA